MTESIQEQNRRSWNAVTPAHNSHKADQADFLRSGGTTLFEEDIELVGDVAGQRLAHLQCNCGQDSLSLVHLGAQVTGVDISDAAIEFAQKLSEDSGLTAQFDRSDVYDWMEAEANRGQYDVAFFSYGALGWLPDIERWANGVERILKPGGRLAGIEFHPVIWTFDKDGKLVEPYFDDQPIHEAEGVTDYVARSRGGLSPMGSEEASATFENPEPAVCFQWTVAQIVEAVLGAGLTLTGMREYPYANGCVIHESMRPFGERRWKLAEGQPDMPLMLGIQASKS